MEMEKLDKRMENLYLDYNRRMLTEQEYLNLRKKFCAEKERLEQRYLEMDRDLGNERSRRLEQNEGVELFREHRTITELNRQLLEELVERIYVDEEKNLTIQFKYNDLFKAYIQE